MKRNPYKIILIILSIGMVFYMTSCNIEKNKTIDITVDNDMCNASLNINTGYNNELVITLVNEESEPPSEVFVEILVNGKSVYNDKLKIEQDKFSHAGIYRCYFDSIRYLERNYENVSLFVGFDNKNITIPLTSIKIIK
ncbi:hypothetical protein [Candidatus Clostridium radicumherbarum]|uniref:Uncharacterized protein n=1 Tax=Candidatus Clostridium radicumherbarum TaxID=3381662 RepID=A0ABW8TZ91_9CLOT